MGVLDVGCGNYPHGVVNIDLFIKSTKHRGLNTAVDKTQTPNLICGLAEQLPIVDNAFSLVFSKAVLEHVDNPVQMIREMIRVSSKRVIIIVPHRYLRDGGWLHYRQHDEVGIHKWFFDEGSLDLSLRTLFPHFWFKIHTKYRLYPNSEIFKFLNIQLIKLPWCLIVEIRKDRTPQDYVTPLSQLSIEKFCGLTEVQ
jgi:SAM-dependent methyltransferase